MRSINKGASPQIYTDYHDARNDLADKLGWYCSYCEMSVSNMIEVEHIHPIANGGNELDWNNFLLSCKYCNTVKRTRNLSRAGYLWPDVDNTILAFKYSENEVITPSEGLSDDITNFAVESINLFGLNRAPGLPNEPTDRDTRWKLREEVRGIINDSYNNWIESPTLPMARQIALTALGSGFYSLWIENFKNIPDVKNAIEEQYTTKGNYMPQYHNNVLVIRQNGIF